MTKLYAVTEDLKCGDWDVAVIRAESEEDAIEKAVAGSPSFGGFKNKRRYEAKEIDFAEGDTHWIASCFGR